METHGHVLSDRSVGHETERWADTECWQNDEMFLGEDLLAWLVLALGGALFVGNALAVVKPPPQTKEGDLARAPVARSVVMALVGLVATVWSLASLVSG
jgi:hypothetical protein